MTVTGGQPRRRAGRWPDTAIRLAAFQAVLLAIVLGGVTFGTQRAFTSHAMDATNRGLAAEVVGYRQAVTNRAAGQDLGSFSVAYLRGRALPAGQFVVVALADGRRVGSAGSERVLESPTVQTLLGGSPARAATRTVNIDGTDTRVITVPLTRGSIREGTLLVAAGLDRLRSDQSRVLVLSIMEAIVALVVGVAGGYLLLRRLLRTVGRMTTAAGAIGEGDLDQRFGDTGTDDELGQLADTFDWMLDRLSLAMVSQRRLLSDVSHQLRTPLTVARGHLEVLARTGSADPHEVRETVALVVDELAHMVGLVERLLLLGRALEPDFVELTEVDLRSFVADLMDAARVLAPRRWSMAPVPDAVVEIDAAKVRGAMLNLIDNAVRATTRTDAIAVAAEVRDGELVLSVEDSGPGIAEGDRAAALTRFARPGGADREGSGLGLAIAKAVAEAHGGVLELGVASLGGCRAVLVLPRRDRAPATAAGG